MLYAWPLKGQAVRVCLVVLGLPGLGLWGTAIRCHVLAVYGSVLLDSAWVRRRIAAWLRLAAISHLTLARFVVVYYLVYYSALRRPNLKHGGGG